MTTHIETEAEIRRMEDYTPTADATVIAWWREHVQPAVPPVPDGCELVDDDGVPAFRVPTEDDYGWLNIYGFLCLTASPLPHPTDPFAGKRYIVHQVAPPVPTDVDRLARLLAVEQGMPWERQSTATKAYYVGKARRLYDHGVRYPDQTP